VTYQDTLTSPASGHALPTVRKIGLADIGDALAKGLDDFRAMPTHVIFLSLIYPLAGLILGRALFGYQLVPLLFPLAAGFALIGPFAAVGLYELSRRREAGLDTSWTHAFDVLYAASFRAILTLGFFLLVVFGLWIGVAESLYIANFGYQEPASIGGFVQQVLNTPEGHNLIIYGNLIGFLFAVVAFSISVVAFPLLVDQNISATAAAATSIRAVLKNPVPMAAWGLIVAAALVIGSLPFLVGLAIVMPVLGHATWHLYRKVVVQDLQHREAPPHPDRPKRYAAEFPVSIFSGYRR